MRYLTRFTLWSSTALMVLAVDIATKIAPHGVVVYNYSHATPASVYLIVGLFLGALALAHSNVIAIGSGLMLGGLCGNAGQLLLVGYATDWIPLGGWFTNVADLSGAAGLLCCAAGYAVRLTAQRATG